jgi:hypothetical protein
MRCCLGWNFLGIAFALCFHSHLLHLPLRFYKASRPLRIRRYRKYGDEIKARPAKNLPSEMVPRNRQRSLLDFRNLNEDLRSVHYRAKCLPLKARVDGSGIRSTFRFRWPSQTVSQP